MQPSVIEFVEFLTQLYGSGVGYSGINTAKSAISSFVHVFHNDISLGTHSVVKRFMRGVFSSRPSLPRYNVTWDVSVVLTYLKTQSPVSKISLIALSRKLAMLILLLSGHRCQSLQLLDLRNIRCSKHCLKVTFGDIIQHTRPGVHTAELKLPAYAPDRRLCVVTVFHEYLVRTKPLRNAQETSLFISTIKPHQAVTRDTLSNWIKAAMTLSGLDMTIFKPHSVRSAVTSAAKLPIATILKTASWSRECTFRKYYKKPIKQTIGESILASVHTTE